MLRRLRSDTEHAADQPVLRPDGVFLQAEDTALHRAVFVNGHPRMALEGQGSLSGFRFLLSHSKLEAAQTAAGTFTYEGSTEEAAEKLIAAGLKQRKGMHGGFHEFRSRGSFLTGANSSHLLLHELSAHPSDLVATGEFHFGEHNPYSPLGWIFHWIFESRR